MKLSLKTKAALERRLRDFDEMPMVIHGRVKGRGYHKPGSQNRKKGVAFTVNRRH